MTKRLNDINTIQHCQNETYLVGTDEHGTEFTIVFSTIDLVESLDIEIMKESLIKYISNL